ncbi:MAG: hypothetical protein IKS83_01055 [Victivallales bacterium]|nr:hypothetical protein [Victivallales bacterium]
MAMSVPAVWLREEEKAAHIVAFSVAGGTVIIPNPIYYGKIIRFSI